MELQEKLDSLGLGQYSTILYENGFEDWNTVLDITEDDLDSLGFKRGHRRILQKEIAIARGLNASPPIETARPTSSTPSIGALVTTQESYEKRTKRRYRWHPRADPNAPKKPKTAYVNFADHLRSDKAIASLSFVDIAREVGRQWQMLDPETKQEWENRAAQAMQEYEEQMDEYRKTKQYQDYQVYLETFKKAPGKLARQKIKSDSASSITSPRRSESSGPDRSPSASIDSPTMLSAETALRDECRSTLTAAFMELSVFRREYVKEQPFSGNDLPSETLVADVEALLHRMYRIPGAADALSLIELCMLAALGIHFARGSISRDQQHRLFATVCVLMEGLSISEASYARLMRVLLCLTIYAITEKHLSARTFITAGLALARLKHFHMDQDCSRDDWRKIYRTLVFTECWLSQTLGYNPRNLDIHIRNAVEPNIPDSSIENAIQWQAVRIAIIGNEISTIIRQQNDVPQEAIRYLSGQLELWQRELPHIMQLASILSSNSGSIGRLNEQAMLVVHIIYLGAMMLLYGQSLSSAHEPDGKTDNPEMVNHRAICLVAGEQISGLIKTISSSQSWSPWSFFHIYWVFNACNVLLLGAAQALRNRSTNDYDRLISHARTCLSSLESCAQDEPVASRYLSMMAPIYEALKRLRESPHVELKRRKSEHKISINDLLASDDGARSPTSLGRWNTIDDELPGIIQQVTVLLRDPFGRAQQNSVADEQYPTPPSNADMLFWFRV
ncbi:uncharacterized protein PV09_06039 [Verruconis gallopava]|uniref:HMG box domain-containing protein n=1 Tax=Verruconis gallopava TaxID=253628 RepID=A0A0D2ATY9_9PEZI|nr:uncharacterized protein PV09_06039 [Verruconis gallopava]KIW02589.1 hypothetical protein PV09_06039 [Verruconis gallopava]